MRSGTTSLKDEQHINESFAADNGGAASGSAVLQWNGSTAVPRRSPAPALPGDLGFSTGTDLLATHPDLPEPEVTTIITAHILKARAQAAGIPRWMHVETHREPSATYLFFKRLADIAIAFVLLLALAPLLLIIGLCIAAEDRGPILYYQTRVGKQGRQFRFYKFRSMVLNADELKKQLAEHNESSGPAFKIRNDPRITRIGRILRKTSLDELPQLMNVLRGEMTLVGPRPHLPNEVSHYADWHYQRLSVQPGLLCLREVLGRSNLTFDQWVAYDLLYTRNRSMRADFWILYRLIPALLKADGAY
jgi:lipopolysaccharide/colanic/teichoic acid biosynthesis glycosyltransferase